MITTRTSDTIANMAAKATAIADAVYEAGYRQEADALSEAALRLANVALSIEGKIEAGARAMLSEPLHDAVARNPA